MKKTPITSVLVPKLQIGSGLALGAAFAILFAAGGATAQDRPLFLNVGSTSTGSGHYPYWVAVGQSIEEGTGGQIQANIMETGAAIDNLRRMRRGEIEFGLITAEAAAQAYLGLGAFEGEEPYEELRTLWYYVAAPNMFIVRADADVASLADLDGRRYNPGIPGSSTESISLAAFEVLGISPDIHRGGTTDAVDATRDGQIVGFTKSAAGTDAQDSSFVELNTFIDVRVLSMTEEEVAQIVDAYPYFPPLEIPPGLYPDQDEPYRTIAVVPGAVASSETLTEEDAYEIVKAVFENKALQEDAFAGVRNVEFAEVTLEFAMVPLHAGAVRYFREIGVEVPEELVPPEAE